MTVVDIRSDNTQNDQLRSKMAELSVEGFSSMGTYTAGEQLAHLNEIEQILARRGHYLADSSHPQHSSEYTQQS